MKKRKTVLGVLVVGILFALPSVSQGDPIMCETTSGITQTFSAFACHEGDG